MSALKTILKSMYFQYFLLVVGLLLVYNTPAFAALEDSIVDIQGKIQAICTPLAIIFLIVAGWQKAIGNNFMFFAALLGTLIMFAAPQIVEVVSASFGG
jgi:type IV secretory pathway VirB2 component (pilin)